jgi:hypothetical protein
MSRRFIVCIDVVNYICYGLFEIDVTRSQTNTNKSTINSHAIIVLVFKCMNTERRNVKWT